MGKGWKIAIGVIFVILLAIFLLKYTDFFAMLPGGSGWREIRINVEPEVGKSGETVNIEINHILDYITDSKNPSYWKGAYFDVIQLDNIIILNKFDTCSAQYLKTTECIKNYKIGFPSTPGEHSLIVTTVFFKREFWYDHRQTETFCSGQGCINIGYNKNPAYANPTLDALKGADVMLSPDKCAVDFVNAFPKEVVAEYFGLGSGCAGTTCYFMVSTPIKEIPLEILLESASPEMIETKEYILYTLKPWESEPEPEPNGEEPSPEPTPKTIFRQILDKIIWFIRTLFSK